jgi:small subunit ribosomal protein S7
MPRKSRSFEKHTPLPDPKFGSVKFAKFINYMMLCGKKSVAQGIFYNALDIVSEKMAEQTSAAPAAAGSDHGGAKGDGAKEKAMEGRQVFEVALKNVCPIMELKSRRIGGANYQVPVEVPEPRKTTLGMKWMISAAQSRKGAPMAEKLALEIIDAYNKVGAAVKKREDVHRMAEANKAFAHFARFGNRRR